MSTSAPFDAGIPVLTEVLREVAPTAVPETASARSSGPASAPAPAPSPAAPLKPAVWRTGTAAAVPVSMLAPPPQIDLVIPEPQAAPAAPAIDLGAIERALGERILAQLMPRVDALVAERLELVLQGLATELRAGLGESVAQAVAAAVHDELALLQAQKG
jgi:hypothetical protein